MVWRGTAIRFVPRQLGRGAAICVPSRFLRLQSGTSQEDFSLLSSHPHWRALPGWRRIRRCYAFVGGNDAPGLRQLSTLCHVCHRSSTSNRHKRHDRQHCRNREACGRHSRRLDGSRHSTLHATYIRYVCRSAYVIYLRHSDDNGECSRFRCAMASSTQRQANAGVAHLPQCG